MKVLMITGDRNFAASPRAALQTAQVEKLEVVFMGRGSLWPSIPHEQYDVVTSQDPFWRGLFAWRLARKRGAKLNVQVHADLSAQPFVRHVLAQIVLRHANSVRVVSEKLKQQVGRIAPRASVHVLPVYINAAKFKNIAREPHDTKTVLWIGRFEDEKDPLLALDVIKKIPDAKLIMLGSGSLESRIKQQISRLNLEKVVELRGWQDPIVYLAQADVVLSTSRHESFGASIIEALAAKVPVVAPDVGVAREAGAIIKERSELAEAAVEVLRSGARGELKLRLLSAEEWAKEWKKTL